MFDIKESLKELPDSPGVYMHKDKLGEIIYVGKAISLKNRVRQYFQSKKNMAPKVRSMVEQIVEFEYISTESEMEALILECNLIKKYRPKYNILLRDDKTYPYIKITNEDYPRIIKTRIVKKDGGKYYGPYSEAGAVNKIVDLLNSTFALKRCSAQVFSQGFRPCLNYHIHQCQGICTGDVSPDDYEERLAGAREFLNGKNAKLLSSLKGKMHEASDRLDYEEAAIYRDYIDAVGALSETQRVAISQDKDMDMIVPIINGDNTYASIFFIRTGKLVGREIYEMETSLGEEKDEIITAFINQYYSRAIHFPKEIILEKLPREKEVIEEYLHNISSRKITLVSPQKGDKKALLEVGLSNAAEMLKTIEDRTKAAKERREAIGKEFFTILKDMGKVQGEYLGEEYRAEAYDISNTNGVDTVGAMIVFAGLKPDKRSYRKFKIRSVIGQDDYSSMKEVLSRRYARLFKGDEKFEVLPDIILMDGGKGHIGIALEVVEAIDLDIAVIGMVKDDKHRTRALIYKNAAGEYVEVDFKGRSMLYKYIGNVQEEVHRFAIEYHRKLRNKTVVGSILDNIKGIGPKRRKALLEHFGNIDKIKEATVGEIEGVEGINAELAKEVYDFFKM